MIVWWVFAFLVKLTESVIFTEQPRLESKDGNLYLIAAQDRNLTLSTSGVGQITVNGHDIRRVIEDAQKVARAASSKDSIIASIRNDVRNLLSERRQIYERLSTCESAYTNGSTLDIQGTFPPPRSSPRDVSSVVRQLRRRVRKIELDLRRNECRPRNPCRNGGTCIDLYLDFLCLCPDGWEGARCQQDVNECADLAGTGLGCLNGGTCINQPGTYKCECPKGFSGKHCSINGDDCSSGPSSELCDHGTCVSKVGGKSGHDCICDQGWQKAAGSSMCSVDVDECATAPCSRSPKVNCINIPGGFLCESCPAGYTGNGFSCEDVDECFDSNGGCSTTPKVACFNTVGSFSCGPCPPGYSGDGITCTYVGKCNVNHGGCHPQATCQEIGGNVICNCMPGVYTGNGIGPNGCIPTGLATQSANSCASYPCLNGRCVQTSATAYTCECFIGFAGTNCQLPSSPCEPNPCKNNGTCKLSGRDSFLCLCSPYFTGKYCTQERMACGGILRGDEGILQFPSNPNLKYRSNLRCAWRISVNSSLIIKLTFDSFDLEASGKNGECFADWLQIYDGPGVGHHNLLGKFCGNALPNNGTLFSSDRFVFIWFKSDRSSNHLGFQLRWNATLPKCGGNVDGKVHGTISSPGTPGVYPKNRDCYWKVSTFLQQRISFTFFKLNIENHDNCSYDYLEVFDGDTTDGSPLIRYCTTQLPAPLVSTGHEATLHFHSDNIGTDIGFQISYSPHPGIPGCGGLFTANKGQIKPVLEDANSYKANMDCVWIIRLLPGLKIKAVVESMEIEFIFNDCRHDVLEIRDGDSENAPLYGRFCGNDIPAPITSSSNSLYIRFRSDHSVGGSGFLLTYEEVCDKVFPEPTGIIKSPNYPNPYKNAYDCYYTIDQPFGKAIRLDFLDFDVEEKMSFSPTCFDYLQVHDGMDSSAPTLMKACGNKRPGQIISTHNKLHLWFHTDGSILGSGWAANYSTFDIACGGVLTSLVGNISSPSHVDGYPPDFTCNWVIAAPPNMKVEISFLSFDLEEKTFDGRCHYDFVALYDNSTNHQIMTKLCGSKLPQPITSTGNIITVQFKTDASAAGDGFQLHYRTINASSVCKGNYFTSTGVLRSPNFPKNYPSDKVCTWTINVLDGQKIRLRTTNFSLEQNPKCLFDKLEIRNGKYEDSPLIGVYCGNQPPPTLTSLSNSLFLRFRSDSLHEFTGFEFRWDSSVTGCGGLLTAAAGSITSPNYPDPYVGNLDCYYTIKTSLGSRIKITLVDVDLEQESSCEFDYIQIFDGPNSQSKSLGKFCTNNAIANRINSTGNQVYIKFKSDGSVGGKGFSLRYSTDCNTRIVGTRRGVIESPNYPEMAPADLNCTWTIEPLIMHTINITFSEFTMASTIIEDSNTCSVEYPFASLEIREVSASSETLGMFCQGMGPPQLISSRQRTESVEISIRLVSSYLYRSKFRLEWVADGCGGTLTHPIGNFSSPGYPDLHPPKIVCIWNIRVDTSKAVVLNISDINLISATSLRVYGGPDESSPLLTEISGVKRDFMSLRSSGNTMYLVFNSTATANLRPGRGFNASYNTVSALRCGGEFFAPEGLIHSVNYPKNYGPKDYCIWVIHADKNHRLQLSFTDFDLINNCTEAFVEMYDGDNVNAPSLFLQCGNKLPNASITSTTNVLTVRMKSDSASSAKGFLASYRWVCGGTIRVDDAGIFKPSALQSGECTVTLVSTQPDGHIALSVYSEDENDGTKRGVRVFEGDDVNATSLGVVPRENGPTAFISNGNSITAQFYTSGNFGGNMHVSYSSVSSACGGQLNTFTGTIASPGYPGSYPVADECVWVIPAAPGNRVQLRFKSFDIQASEACNLDSVEIREGSGEGKHLGTFCGSTTPELLEGEGLWVKFSSNDDGDVASGFLAEFSFALDNEVVGTEGNIASPFYPQLISRMGKSPISWRITGPNAQKIRISFNDFAADRRTHSTYLKIYDGFDISSKSTDLTGSPLPQPFLSSSNVVFVQLTAVNDDSTVFDGSSFKLHWQTVKQEWKPFPKKTSTCGEDFEMGANNSVTIKSPNYPNHYPKNSRCTWVVRAQPGFHISYQIKHLDIAEFANCAVDTLKFYDGEYVDDSDAKPLHTYCLKNETQSRSSKIEVGSILTITFTSWYINDGTGFEILLRHEIGGVFEASDGVISLNETDFSVFNSKNYFEWRVTVGRGRRINVTFDEFSVAAGIDGLCTGKFLMLRNGNHADSPLLGRGKYCGTKPNPSAIPLTTSNELYIKANGGNSFLSFTLHFREIQYTCGGRIELTEYVKSVEFTTPNYPNSPHPKSECVWIVKAPVGKTIQLDFLGRFDLFSDKKDSGCRVEYVELRDGATPLAELLGTFCSEAPNSIISSDNLLYIKYYSNATDPHNGFKAIVAIDKCGGVLRSTEGFISTPGYPELPADPIDCIWTIQTIPTKTISVNFTDFDFPPSNIPENTTGKSLAFFVNIKEYNNFVVLYEEGLFIFQSRRPMLRTFPPFEEMTGPSIGRQAWSPGFRMNRIVPKMLGLYTKRNVPMPIMSTKSTMRIRVRLNVTRGYRGFKLSFKTAIAECGGELFTPDGIITTPHYPRLAPIPMYCEWKIHVPVGRRISATFTDFDVPDYMQRKTVALSNDRTLLSFGSFSQKSPPTGVYKSSGNVMVVLFASPLPSGPNFRGFKMEYSSDEAAVCGGILNDTEFSIEPPKNMTVFDCIWELPIATGINVSHIFKLVDIHAGNASVYCSYRQTPGLFIAAEGGSSLYSVCGDAEDQIFGTAVGPIRISAILSQRSSPVTFRLKYKKSPCGGYLSPDGLPAVITSPGYPEPYSGDVDCVWRVSTFPGQTLKITFDAFQLDSSCKDYLQIKNGQNWMSPLVATYCGSKAQIPNIVSEGRSLFLHFHSVVGSAKGFQISIDNNHTECGGMIHNTATKLLSPNYPAKYGNNMECEWEINTEPGFHIGLVFMERFQLEDSPGCKNDSVEVFDYIDGNWTSASVHCGRNMPAAINSTGTKMRVRFRSNSAVVGDGFKARWENNCGGSFTGTKGTIVSPGYPQKYPENLHCTYHIVNKENMVIEFKFFELERPVGGKCNYDYLEVVEEGYIGSIHKSKRKFCGTNVPKTIESTKDIIIVFHSDFLTGRRGFELTYSVDECGGRITSPTVIERKWRYPNMGKPCSWWIETSSNMVVSIMFTDLVLPAEDRCRWGSLSVNDPARNTTLATLCGSHSIPIPILSSSNILQIVLKRFLIPGNYSITAIITFTYGEASGCGGKIRVKDNPEVLVSPDVNRDGMYEEFLDCHWIIEAPESHFLTVKFLSLDVNACNSTDCTCDYVEIRDGNGPLSDLIVKACGNVTSEALTSSSNALWVRFKSDGSYGGKGFTIQFSALISPCGLGRLTATSEIKKLVSPNYPDAYPANSHCSWSIFAQPPNITGNTFGWVPRPYIHIFMTNWDIEESQDCRNDYLTIEDLPANERKDGSQQNRVTPSGGVLYIGQDKELPRNKARWLPIGRSRYCGKNTFANFYAPSGQALVRFVSNEAISKKGFSLEYSTNVCGRNFTGKQGRIRLNYLPPAKNCYLRIQAPFSNQTISLYFGKFHSPINPNCTSAFLQVNEGSFSGPQLMRDCGYMLPSPIFSSGPKLFITMYDSVGYRSDVDITYTTTDQGPGCGGVIDNHAGVFTSPYYPNYVRNNSICLWQIFVPEDLVLNMHFAAFDLGSSSTCSTDYVEIYNCDDFGAILGLHSKLCGGDTPGNIQGTGNAMAVKYTRSLNSGGTGWQINFAGLASGYTLKEW